VTGLQTVRVIQNGRELATAAAGPPGLAQSYPLDVSGMLNTEQSFAVRVESRSGSAALSNTVSIRPTDVPGTAEEVRGIADQFKIRLSWQPPRVNAALAAAYLVRRSDRPEAWESSNLSFDDSEVELGKAYVYTVTALTAGPPPVPGPTGAPLTVVANDTTPPAQPSGLAIDPTSAVAGIGVLTWTANTEADLAGYRVYRSAQPENGFELRTPSPVPGPGFSDPGYQSGLYYRVHAVDAFGNESRPSAVLRGP
jgi:hypothetical protein